MPPEQCPDCGRFLKQAFVTGLADAAAPCPRCGIELSLDRLAAARQGADPASDDASVRPPDLQPDAVRDLDDPVAGWDVGVPVAAGVRDERPFPLDTVVVAGAGIVGATFGAVLGRRTVRDALLGGLGGVVGAGVVRRIWQLP